MAWMDTLNNDERSHAASKGWDRLEPEAAAAAIAKSYRELERIRPAPVAVPASPAEYTFEGLTHKDGSAPDAGFLDFARGLAAELKLPVAAAQTFASKLVAYGEAAEAAELEAVTAARTAGETALKTAWGQEYEAKFDTATKAFEALGLPAEVRASLEASMGFDKAHDLAYNLGTRMGEAPLLKGSSVEQKVARTREQALAERNRLTSDPVFGKKIIDGDLTALQELNDLSRDILGDPKGEWSPPPENFGRRGDNLGQEIKPPVV